MWDFYMPAHGEWCNARTYPTTCPHCGQRVFFFTCDHGSRVFFDELGPPWPKHRCFEGDIETYGREFMEHAMAVRMKLPGGIPVGRPDSGTQSVKTSSSRPSPSPQPIIRCLPDPESGPIEDVGIVREIVPLRDVLSHFGRTSDEIISHLLEKEGLLQEEQIQVTVHARSEQGDGEIPSVWFSYTFLVPRTMWEKEHFQRGHRVQFVVRSSKALEFLDIRLWVCEELVLKSGSTSRRS